MSQAEANELSYIRESLREIQIWMESISRELHTLNVNFFARCNNEHLAAGMEDPDA